MGAKRKGKKKKARPMFFINKIICIAVFLRSLVFVVLFLAFRFIQAVQALAPFPLFHFFFFS
jgi:hypothetical protein